jgi:hypothetical protein
LFSGNPIWPGVIPDGWEIEWENDNEECYAWMNHVYFYVLKTWFVILSTCGLLCNAMMYSGLAFVWA